MGLCLRQSAPVIAVSGNHPVWRYHCTSILVTLLLSIMPFSNATKCSLLYHFSLPIILYYALSKFNHFTIIIIFCCTEAWETLQWYSLQEHVVVDLKTQRLAISLLTIFSSSRFSRHGLGLKVTSHVTSCDLTWVGSKFYWHNSLVLEVPYCVQNNASIMWKSLLGEHGHHHYQLLMSYFRPGDSILPSLYLFPSVFVALQEPEIQVNHHWNSYH